MPTKTLHKKGSKSVRYARKRVALKKPSALRRIIRFLPAILIFGAAFSLHTAPASGSGKNFNTSVLSYATSMSSGELLTQTNAQRAQNGVSDLSLNSQLSAAAQAKANDMVARNYWAHTTPTGEEPWYFMSQAGYQYKTAGENLAYGFDNSADTVTGWMNSPPHRENLLKSSFLDVGFGYANSPDYVSTGQQTIVVAMYGAQIGQSAPAAVQQSNNTPSAQPQAKPTSTTPTPETEPVQATPEPAPTPTETAETTAANSIAKERSKPAQTAKPVQVRRIQVLTGGNARWSSTLLISAICGMGILWTLQRGREMRNLINSGERFLLHHIHMDLTVAAFIALGYTMLQTTGTIR